MGTKSSLIDKDEIDRISKYFEDRPKQGYMEILERVTEEESEDERVSIFQSWVSGAHPEFAGLFEYDHEVTVFISRVLEKNIMFLSPEARRGIIAGGYEIGFEEVIKKEIPALVPAKQGTPGYVYRFWEDKEVSILNELISEGRVWKDAYLIYLGRRIGKIGRTEQAFRMKWRRIVRKIMD